MSDTGEPRVIRAPRGSVLTAKSWLTEAALRMLMNNLDPEVAERPGDLVVYGGIGRAARDWKSFDRIVETLRRLEADQTLLVQSGKPVGVFRTHADAPRVLIANSNLVPRWATWEHFHELDRKGLMMFGQMTAGSWIYIGSQGIVQGTYETFVEMGRQHFGGDLAGKWILTAGLGGMGGAQPLAATMAGASMLAIECRPERMAKRLETRYLDHEAATLDEALAMLDDASRARRAISVGLLGNACEVLPELLRRGVRPDAVTDQTSAHDPINGYLPEGWTLERWDRERVADPSAVDLAARRSMAKHVQSMLEFQSRGVPVFDYGNNIRQVALDEGVRDAFAFPGFVPQYIRPLFCRGIGPFRWAALSGDPADIHRTDARVRELIPDDPHLHRWLDMARERIAFQGLPARICWVGLGDRHRLGLAFNEMVARGELSAPIVIGRDHLDSGSVASPNRETEAMRDGSDAVSDWPLLNALLNTASGATWVSLHHGGGVGMGYSQHAGVVIVCDGTPEAARRIERVLWNDPATGVMRHADAGYEIAIECAKSRGLDLPGISGERAHRKDSSVVSARRVSAVARAGRIAAWLCIASIAALTGLAGYLLAPVWSDPTPGFMQRKGRLVAVDEGLVTDSGAGRTVELRLHSDSGLVVDIAVRRPHGPDLRRPAVLLLGGFETGRNAVRLVDDAGGQAVAAISYPLASRPGLRGLRAVANVAGYQRGILDTVPAILLALDYLSSQSFVDPSQIELVGVSLGAFFVAPASALDSRVRRVWIVHGSGDPGAVIELALRDEIRPAPLRRAVAAMLNRIAAGDYLAAERWVGRISPREVIVINARDEERLPRAGIESLHAALGQPHEILWTHGGHVQPNRPEVLDQLGELLRCRVAGFAVVGDECNNRETRDPAP